MAGMYSAKVMEHFAHPHNVGEIPDANGVGEVGNAKCGDIMRMYLKIENNVIVDVKFLTFGCGAAIATSSMATDLIKGKTIDDALKLTNKAVVEALEGLPPIKVHCSVLAEQAVKSALSDYYRRQGVDPEPIVGKLEEDCDHCELRQLIPENEKSLCGSDPAQAFCWVRGITLRPGRLSAWPPRPYPTGSGHRYSRRRGGQD